MTTPKRHTDHPASGQTAWGATQLTRILDACGSVPPGATLEETVGPALEIIADLEEGAAAGIRLQVRGSEKTFERRSPRAAPGHQSGPPKRLTPAPVPALFRDLPIEHRVALGAPLEGTLHFATPAMTTSVNALLDRAATIVTLLLRAHPELAVAELAQLEKLATIGQTASQIVHELNNPLTAIIAYSDYLAQRMRGTDMAEGDLDRLTKINEAAARIQRFCRELTDYSRPAGSLLMRVDLREVIDNALSFCVHGLRSADITVERVYREIPPIEGVDTALTQVFVNLITNAWHAMPQGGTLSLRTRTYENTVIVEVADEGRGISDADLERIFDAYFTTKPKGSGVGLGLSIVKQIVTDHGGEVRAQSRQPRGTVFVLSFPPIG